MATPKVTLGWYLFAKLWLENARVLKWDTNYSRLGYAMAQSDPHRPIDGDLEYYMKLAELCKQLLESPDYIFFDGKDEQSELTSCFRNTDSVFVKRQGTWKIDSVNPWLKGVEQEIVWLEYDKRYGIVPKVKLPMPVLAVEPEDSE